MAPSAVDRVNQVAKRVEQMVAARAGDGGANDERLMKLLEDVRRTVASVPRPKDLNEQERWRVRSDLLRIDRSLQEFESSLAAAHWSEADLGLVAEFRAELNDATDFARPGSRPPWHPPWDSER